MRIGYVTNENYLMKMKMWQKENSPSQVHHEMVSVRKNLKLITRKMTTGKGFKWGFPLFSRYRITNMTSATVPGLGMPGAWGVIFQHRFQDFSFQSKRNRSKFFPGVFKDYKYDIGDCPRVTFIGVFFQTSFIFILIKKIFIIKIA